MRSYLNSVVATFAVLAFLLAIGTEGLAQNNSVVSGTITVVDSSTAVVNVSVILSSIDRAIQTKSAANGRFPFQNVPAGTYGLEFAAEGFAKQKLAIELPDGATRSLTIVLKPTSQPDLNYCGPHPSVIYASLDSRDPELSGVVHAYVRHHERPVSKAEVALWRAGDRQTKAISLTDGRGKFKFNNLPADRYDLRISRSGYVAAEVKQLLVPRENSVSIEIPILRDDKKFIVCQ